MVFGTLQDSLNKHAPAVTHASQRRPQGAPAGPLNLFRYLRANLPYFKLNQCPAGDLLYCCKATRQPLHHNNGPHCLRVRPYTYRKDSGSAEQKQFKLKIEFSFFFLTISSTHTMEAWSRSQRITCMASKRLFFINASQSHV